MTKLFRDDISALDYCAPPFSALCKQREIAGIRAMLVHTISEAAKRFYEGYGFVTSPVDPLTVMITVAEAVKILRSKRLK